ncbi:MAG: hypothetical protein IBX57_00240 [Gammaproteobacteria bacterium]|nr:hypothetical protein [Gammaproteobacteria bacterium]
MSETELKTLRAGLQFTNDVYPPLDKDTAAYTNVVQGEFTFPVTKADGRLSYCEEVEQVFDEVCRFLRETNVIHTHWRLLIALDGRCWFIEPNTEIYDVVKANPNNWIDFIYKVNEDDKPPVKYELGYFDYPDSEEWCVIGVEPVKC